ncbi:cytochrome c oxidase subunit 3 [Gloeothece verrucosa]|uniref:Cytochrome-c oxidase n=1 Tax=Gloeothece verrucosa (strain PCC 7822) TaxID=497965 RepID=E0UL93_GLOV7|nr:heme-copper oxidase subunit III [Gloeothece verrucosa]ADN17723.1 Cytochrome-c oxidase [Gloeothece verrucosa PCC 7822]
MPRHIHIDDSPIRFERLLERFPHWLQRFLPTGGGDAENSQHKSLFGVTVFLLSESLIFLSFILTYLALKYNSSNWLPPGVKGPELTVLVAINTVVLLSSSLIIQWAENALKKRKINKFRALWLTTSLMGIYFLVGQKNEWNGLDFGLKTAVAGGAFYVLTGFHGLHVLTGVLLQLTMFVRSWLPNIYKKGHFGVSAVTLFWHFVDVIWIFLFLIIYIL